MGIEFEPRERLAAPHGIGVGELPLGLAIDLADRINQQELTVDAALTGDRNLALHALLAVIANAIAVGLVEARKGVPTQIVNLLKAHSFRT